MKHWGVKQGDRVGIVGFGGLGHTAAKIATALGASVTVFSTHPEKEKDAHRLGFGATKAERCLCMRYSSIPWSINDMSTPSYTENANAKPLNKAMMAWFFKYYGGDPKNPYALPMKAKSLKGLPPTTVITAEIDPLRSEGQAYAQRLKADGVTVKEHDYTGVTHEFFGMGAVVKKAKDAEDAASADLKAAFK